MTAPNSRTGNNGSLIYTTFNLNTTTSVTNINLTGQANSLKYSSTTKSVVINRQTFVQIWDMRSLTMTKQIFRTGITTSDTIRTGIICNNVMIVVEGLRIVLY